MIMILTLLFFDICMINNFIINKTLIQMVYTVIIVEEVTRIISLPAFSYISPYIILFFTNIDIT